MLYPKLILILFLISLSTSLNAIEYAATYIGADQCKTCHQKEYKLWQGSHHDMAMKHANNKSVLGDFNNVSLKLSATTSRFYKKDKQYWVNIQGPDGKLHDYQIKYTFGFQPLQQYMVEFNDGRVQLIPYAWDSRSKQQGGQRWFNLYPEFTEKHQEFYWTNTGQNWNYMCADCHSTNVKKNFNVAANEYKTTWSEINVACEACHGPASNHIKWTKTKKGPIGFNRDLNKPVNKWISKENKSTLQPDIIHQTQQTLVCAQCHSRHTQISENEFIKSSSQSNSQANFQANSHKNSHKNFQKNSQKNSMGDRYRLTLINSENYYADGQVYDEDYVYGSFLQSKMHKKGVTCSNCHDPHSAKLSLPKETLCLQCHQAETYNTQKHHHHPKKSSGAQCVNCHMPETTYMQIDQRADHGLHIPRPDLSLKLGTPDTCLSCHKEKNSQWSNQQLISWFPTSKIDKQNDFAPAFTLADMRHPQATTELTKISQNKNYADIIRASAIARMQEIPDQNSLISIARGTKDKSELIRLGAIQGSLNMPHTERWRMISPLLSDTVLAVRAEAASVLAPLWQNLNEQQRSTLQPALDDYLGIQHFNADRGFAHTNRGNIMAQVGRYADAETAYNQSIRIDPTFSTAYVNKAELYRRQGNEEKTKFTLEQGIKAQPDGGDLYYNLGLSMIRSKRKIEAIEYLKKATEVSPQNSNYHYVYALSLLDSQPAQAQQVMHKTYQMSGNPRHLYTLCEMQIKQKSFQAKRCLTKLAKIVPANVVNTLQQLLLETSQK